MINIGSTSLGGKVLSFNSDLVRIQFLNPVCANEGEKIAMSRRIDRNFRLIGWGQIKKGYTSKSKKIGQQWKYWKPNKGIKEVSFTNYMYDDEIN